VHIAEGSLKQWFPNGKLLLLSLTKCHGVPCSLPSRITTRLGKLPDFFFKTETKTKTKCSRRRSRPRLSFLFSRRLETKTLVSRTTSLVTNNILLAGKAWKQGNVGYDNTKSTNRKGKIESAEQNVTSIAEKTTEIPIPLTAIVSASWEVAKSFHCAVATNSSDSCTES